MPDHHYENPKLAELYDLDSPWSVDRDFYLALAGRRPNPFSDLGCGTGLLCDAYAAQHHHVTGVDPSAAMLDIARRKPHGRAIEWVQASAQKYRSNKRVDLVIMTGHAFQTLLEDDDIFATFATMRHHLADGGRVVFESRNPSFDWVANWNYDLILPWQRGQVQESRRFLAMKHDRMTFELRYHFPDETLTSISELRFWSKEEIESRLSAAGLWTEKILGDWDARPFDAHHSQEMIFVARTTK